MRCLVEARRRAGVAALELHVKPEPRLKESSYMTFDDVSARRMAWAGIVTGLLASGMYLARVLLDLPTFLSRPFWIFIGPLMCVAFLGVFAFLGRERLSAALIVGTVFGVLAGAFRLVFSVVQSNTLFTIRRHMADAATEVERQVWGDILTGVFTVQNGINYAYDLFLDWGILLLAFPLWRVSRGGRILAVWGAAVTALHFTAKLITFPEPPAEAGLFDVGPAVSAFVLMLLSWMAWRLAREGHEDQQSDPRERKFM